VDGVKQLELVERQLLDASNVPEVLAAGCEILEFVIALTAAADDLEADMYPAFMFARSSAVGGRNAIAFAPSLPAGHAAQPESPPPITADAYEIADALAGLASTLSVRLRETAARAPDAGDRIACQTAAREAEQINELLAGSK